MPRDPITARCTCRQVLSQLKLRAVPAILKPSSNALRYVLYVRIRSGSRAYAKRNTLELHTLLFVEHVWLRLGFLLFSVQFNALLEDLK